MTGGPRGPTDEGDTASRVGASLLRGGELLGFRVVQYGLGFLSSLVISRALGPAGRAGYALPLALATTVLLTSHLSVELAISRLLGRREASVHEMARLAAVAAVVLGVIATALMLAVGFALPDDVVGDASSTALILAAASLPPSMFSLFAAAILFRLGTLRPWGVIQVSGAAGQLGLLAALELGVGLSPESVLAVNVGLTCWIALGLGQRLVRELSRTERAPSSGPGLWKRVLGAGLALHPSSLALFLNLRLDLFIVAAYLGAHEAGLYSLATMLAELVLLAATTMGIAALRDQATLSERESAVYTLDFARQSLGLAGLLAAGTALLSFPLIRVLYGEDWTAAALPLSILSLASLALAIESPVRGLLLRLGRPISISLAAVLGTVLNVALCLLLVPRLELVGAALASLASYSLTALLMLHLMRRVTGLPIRRAVAPGPDDVVARAARRLKQRRSTASS